MIIINHNGEGVQTQEAVLSKVDNHTGIALIEGRYWERANVSYRGVFELLSETNSAALSDGQATSNDYHYETANSRAAFTEILQRLAGMTNIRYICIAGHGESGGVSTLSDDIISCAEIGDILASCKKQIFDGIHFSTCNTINLRSAKAMLSRLPSRKWVSGYRKQIGFIEASALDMLFFNCLIETTRVRPMYVIQESWKRLSRICGPLTDHLGFGIFITDASTGEVRDICGSP